MSSPSPSPSKRHIDSDELIRFAKNTSSLIRNVLEKVHRLPLKSRKKLKSSKKRTHQPGFQRESQDRQWIKEPAETYRAETVDPDHRWSENMERPVREPAFDIPLGYFLSNMYEDEELSVENLLPSLTPDDFPIHGSQYPTPAVQYIGQHTSVQRY